VSNPIVEYLQNFIGQEVTESPSAFSLWLNGRLLHAIEGDVKGEYTVREDMTNPLKNLHGGVVSGIMDDIMGLAVFTLNKESFFTSVNLQVDFLAPAKIGEVIQAHAKVVRNGRNIVNVECTVTHINGKIIAKGTSNLVVTPNKVE
jgi:uncharacterized protein (TIGR00369 family)